MLDVIEFKSLLNTFFRNALVEEDDDTLKIVSNNKEYGVSKEYLNNLFSKLDAMNTDSETIIYDDKYFEILTRGENSYSVVRLFTEGPIKKEDGANGITYEYKPCSDEYILFILNKLNEAGVLREKSLRRRFISFGRLPESINSLLDVLKFMYRIETVTVLTDNIRSKIEMERLSNSFLFQLGYNLNAAIIELRFLEEFIKDNRILRLRRSNIDEMDAPKRKYVPDLVYHYQMAIAAESPMLQFLSYFHVMEHFFEKIYNEEIIKSIEKKITNPQFSPKREKDLKGLVKLISSKIKERGENYTFNEKEALTLTLTKFVDIDSLKAKLREYDEDLLDYFRQNEVNFSKGDRIQFDAEEEQIFSKLASRIYKTRNAIVHSKDGEKSKFTPFTDDKHLINEIPLMRFIAEDIIVENSTLI